MNTRNWFKKYGHSLLLLYLPVFLLCFYLLEQYQAPSSIEVYCRLDSYIPFVELFIVPYLLWFPFILGGVSMFFYLSFREPDIKRDFLRLAFMLITGLSFCLLSYVIWPSMLHLRPETYPRNNLFTHLCGLIQGIDPPTNVCPSMHVYTSAVMFYTLWNSRYMKQNIRWRKIVRISSLFLTILIILSTMFIKQHSVIDVVLAIFLSIILYFVSHIRKRGCRTKKVLK